MLKTALLAAALRNGQAICVWPAWFRHHHITKTLPRMASSKKRSFLAGSESIVLAMKLTMVLLTAGMLNVCATGISQNVTFSGEKVPLIAIFKSVEKQTGFLFLSPGSVLRSVKPVSISAQNLPLDQFLVQLFNPLPLKFTIKGRSIFVSLKPAYGAASYGAFNFPDTIKNPVEVYGMVFDADRIPLAGATVSVKGVKNSTITKTNGRFTLNVSEGDVIFVSFVAHKTIEILISSAVLKAGSLNDIILLRSTSPLDEVQVIGYGSTTKRLNTGNVSSVKADEISKQPVSNGLAALQGRVPGLDIEQSTGAPGSAFRVRIRGQNSISSGNDPLFVIDGVPFLSATGLGSSSTSTVLSGGSPLNTINPLDIASIDILKDADATAIYGSRGANGVILITTKKNKSGKTELQANVYTGEGRISRKMDLLNSKQYLQMRREAFANDNAVPQFYDYDLGGLWDTTQSMDWQKELIGGKALITDAQISLNGGTANTNFKISGGYRKESSVFPDAKGYQRASTHFSLGHTSTDQKLKINFSGGYYLDHNELPDADLTYTAISLPPVAPPVYNGDGTLNWANSSWTNPFSAVLNKYKVNTQNLLGNAVITYDLSPSITVRANLGYNNIQTDEISAFPLTGINPLYISFGAKASAVFSNKKASSWIAEPQITWTHRYSLHYIEVLLGASKQEQTNQSLTQTGRGFLSDQLIEDIHAASQVLINSNAFTKYKYLAFFGRITYRYNDKYLVNLSARRDGSSRFGLNQPFANFGAIGAGYIFSEEKFIQSKLPFLSYGKVRTSYGTTGNDQIGDYQYLDTWSTDILSYQGGVAILPQRLLNLDYGWEVNRKFEVAVELGFFKDRILLQSAFYLNSTNNQLVGFPQPLFTGFGSVQANLPAVVRNTGLEAELNTLNIKTSNFSWRTSFNITFPRNKLVSYPNIEGSGYANTYSVGRSLYIKKRLHVFGVDPITGLYMFEDFNKDSQISYPEDIVPAKEISKTVYGGFRNSFQYKRFELDVLFQFVKQTGYGFEGILAAPGFVSNQPVAVINNWKKPGDQAAYLPFTQDYGSAVYNSSIIAAFYGDNSITDASYIRLKNMSLVYNAGKIPGSKKHQRSLKIYVQGQNLLTIADYTGLDPENQSLSNLPPLKIITAGIQVGI